MQARASAAMQSQKLPAVADPVIDAGFDAWLRAHWDPPAAPLQFLVPSRLAWVPLEVQEMCIRDRVSRAPPSMPGMEKSVMTRSGRTSSICRSAVKPSVCVVTS